MKQFTLKPRPVVEKLSRGALVGSLAAVAGGCDAIQRAYPFGQRRMCIVRVADRRSQLLREDIVDLGGDRGMLQEIRESAGERGKYPVRERRSVYRRPERSKSRGCALNPFQALNHRHGVRNSGRESVGSKFLSARDGVRDSQKELCIRDE